VCESLAHKGFRAVAVVRDPAAAVPDDIEESFAVDHLAPFQLNLALEGQVGERGLHVKGRVDPDRTPYGRDFHHMRTYCDTKRANLPLVPLFARRWQDAGVTIDAVSHDRALRRRFTGDQVTLADGSLVA